MTQSNAPLLAVREALEFYANPESWKRWHAKPGDEAKHFPCGATVNRHHAARNALTALDTYIAGRGQEPLTEEAAMNILLGEFKKHYRDPEPEEQKPYQLSLLLAYRKLALQATITPKPPTTPNTNSKEQDNG